MLLSLMLLRACWSWGMASTQPISDAMGQFQLRDMTNQDDE
jgi:hypothetical protein